LTGTGFAGLRCPPTVGLFSNSVTRCPNAAATGAAIIQAAPAPTTAIRFAAGAGSSRGSGSWQARGFTRQLASLPKKV
jgi:septal ring-binding cell division protein DamX